MASCEIINTQFGEAVIKKVEGERYRVVFIDSGYSCFALKKDIESDVVIDYLTPRVCGVGFGDYYQARFANFQESVALWKSILRKVYVRGEATIDPSWHDFRVFRQDFKKIPFSKPYLRDGLGELKAQNNHYSIDTLKIWRAKEAE